MSQPSANANIALSGSPSRPLPMNTTSSGMPASANAQYTRENPSLNGSDDVVGERQRRRAGAALARRRW